VLNQDLNRAVLEWTPANEIRLVDSYKKKTLTTCCIDPLRPPGLSECRLSTLERPFPAGSALSKVPRKSVAGRAQVSALPPGSPKLIRDFGDASLGAGFLLRPSHWGSAQANAADGVLAGFDRNAAGKRNNLGKHSLPG